MNEFQPVKTAAERTRLLREGSKTAAAAMIWTRNQKHVINCVIGTYSHEDRVIYAWVPGKFDLKAFDAELGKLGLRECYFSVSLTTANVFFKAELLGYDGAGLRYKQPSEIYKVQRRADMRMPIPDGYVLKVTFPDPLDPHGLADPLTRKVIDISAGGMAFHIDEKDIPLYPKDLRIKDMTFSIAGKKINVDAEVRHVRTEPEGGRRRGARVGVQFKTLSPPESHHIAQWVFQESRRFLTKVMG